MSTIKKLAGSRLARVTAIRSAEYRALVLAARLIKAELKGRERWAPLLPLISFVLDWIVKWAGSRR